MNETFKDLIIVQYFPIDHRIGRYAYTREDYKDFNEKFREQVHASDLEHQSIILYLDRNLTGCTVNEIEEMCILAVNGR